MLFSSATFLFLFLPIVCATYLFVRNELKNYVLLLASIIFYAWGEPRYLAIILTTIVINYVGAILIDKSPKYKRLTLFCTILIDLGFLFYFKYFNFVMTNINKAFASDIPFLDVIMPIGISFYTFQALSYVVDVYRGETKVQKDIYKLALYICLFPQLIAGPIVKYHDVSDQIDKRSITFDKVSYGVKRFIVGLSKKMLIANTMGLVADQIFALPAKEIDILTAWLGALAYTFQIFYDFSGYSDMAIGLGFIFGFKFLENFNYPYISKSITEFWRRWHISLSTWFKEYLYIPLGGNRVSKRRTYLNLFIVFLATGIWHGAEWTFLVWGLWHGFFIILERLTDWHKKEGGKLLNGIKHIYTILVFILGWVLFRADSLSYAKRYIKNMFNIFSGPSRIYDFDYYINNNVLIIFWIAFICSMPIFKNILHINQERKILRLMINCWLLILFVLSSASIAASTYNPFIYFRF